MIDKIIALENKAKQLEPETDQRNVLRQEVILHSENFLQNIGKGKMFSMDDDRGMGVRKLPVNENGHDLSELLSIVKESVDKPGLNPASGGHLGYIPGGGIFLSSLGDYLADVTNRYAGVFYAGPGAVRMENFLLDWMAEIVGYPSGSAGNLTSGGSVANLSAIVAARDAMGILPEKIRNSVIYLTDQVHHCVGKAIRIAGLGEAKIRNVPLDDHFRMNVSALEEMIKEDLKNELLPWLVIGSAGTTDTGSVDPMKEIGRVAHHYDLWFHVDAAYGGFFILTEEGKKKLEGIELSDSVVMDPHKGLFLPYGTGAVIVRNKEDLHRSHYYIANYMQDTLSFNEELSPADLSAELTKHFRGLRLWLPLMHYGLAPFRAGLEEKLLLSKYFHSEMKKIPGMETGPDPELSVSFFRFIPKNEDPDNFNEKLLRHIHEDGRVFVSSTKINGKFYIRCAILCFRTHLNTVDLLIEMIKEGIGKLER